MTGIEIFSAVSKRKQEIESIFDPTTFVLNPRVQELEREINELQEECPHRYTNGICDFCGKEEK